MGVADKMECGIQWLRLLSRKNREMKKILDPQRQLILNEVQLEDEQKAQIDDIYVKNYGKKIPYDWHRLYTAYTGRFDARYFPEILYIPRFEFFMNPSSYAKVFDDKNLLPILTASVEGISVPKTILSCCNGLYRNEKLEIVSKKTAGEILKNIDMAFVKPTVDSSSGVNCRVIEFCGGGAGLMIGNIMWMTSSHFMATISS